MELNRDQIVKALECCYGGSKCSLCPLYGKDRYCFTELGADSLFLIKELTEENERLKAEKEAENKELFYKWKKLADETANRYEGLYQDANKSLVADTVSELQTRFALRYGTYTDKDMTPIIEVFMLLDQIAKEMLEGEKHEI
jgi:hypothetical protein